VKIAFVGLLCACSLPVMAEEPDKQRLNSDWELFDRGKLPSGTFLNDDDAALLPEGNLANERLYLIGTFVVTASNPLHAVVRSPAGKVPNLRVIVDYPAGAPAPQTGTTLFLDESCAYQIISAFKVQKWGVNLKVRAITRAKSANLKDARSAGKP
jgi:hypothetical protein